MSLPPPVAARRVTEAMQFGEGEPVGDRVMGLGDPQRVRSAVRHRGHHIGYVTVASYPDRDLLHFSAGSPYSEVVVSDLDDKHVALLQCYKEHWLIHCGTAYGTTSAAGRLTVAQVTALATFALARADRPGRILVDLLKERLDRVLPVSEPRDGR